MIKWKEKTKEEIQVSNINKDIEKEFLDYVKKINAYNEALALIYWDLRTGAPKKGIEQRSEVIGILSSEVFRMTTSEEMSDFYSCTFRKRPVR